jgi:hypothetical protein
MSAIWTHRQMQDLPLDGQARKAIKHTLAQIRDNYQVGYHMGVGTQSFALLTEAAATLFGESDIEKLRKEFAPKSATPADTEIARDIRSKAQDYAINFNREKASSQRLALAVEFAHDVLKIIEAKELPV